MMVFVKWKNGSKNRDLEQCIGEVASDLLFLPVTSGNSRDFCPILSTKQALKDGFPDSEGARV